MQENENVSTVEEAVPEITSAENREPDNFDLAQDAEEIVSEFPSTSGKTLDELVNKRRYGELRSLGLSAKEAFLATAKREPATYDNRSHLSASSFRSVHAPHSAMSTRELTEAREIFSGLSDEEIRNLYQRVTKQR